MKRPVLFSHLRLGLPSGLFPSGVPNKTLFAPHFSLTRSTRPAHLILLDFITRIGMGSTEQQRSLSSSLCNFPIPLLPRFLLRTNILLSTLFSNNLSLSSSLNVSDQVSHPYKTRGKLIVL
jgi:hypothetical protein